MPFSPLPPNCPLCLSPRVVSRNWARKTAGAIGCAAGATGGFVGALRGAQIGIASGLMTGPAGSTLGGIAGAVLGGLAGTAIGCEVGTSVGKTIDTRMLDNFKCLECRHVFARQESTSGYADSD